MVLKDGTDCLNYKEWFQILPLLLEKDLIDCYHDNLILKEKEEDENHTICKWYEQTDNGNEKESVYKALCLSHLINKNLEGEEDSMKYTIFKFLTDSILAPERLDRCHLNLLEAKRRARKRENVINEIQTIENDNIYITDVSTNVNMITKSQLKTGITKIRDRLNEAIQFYSTEDFTSRLNIFRDKIYHTKYDNTINGFFNRYMKPIEALSKLPKAVEKPFCQPMTFGITELKVLSMTRMLPDRILEKNYKDHHFKHFLNNGEEWKGKNFLLGMLRLKMMTDKLNLFKTIQDNANLLTTSDARLLENYLSEKVKNLSTSHSTTSWKQTLNNLSKPEDCNLFETNKTIACTSPSYQLVPFSSKKKERTNLSVKNIVLTKTNRFIKTLPTKIESYFLEKILQTDIKLSDESNVKKLVSFLAILIQRKNELVLPKIKEVTRVIKLRFEILRYEKKQFWLTLHMPGYFMGRNMIIFLINCLYLILFLQNFNWCIDFHVNGEMLHCVSESLLEPKEITNIQGTLILVPGHKQVNPSTHLQETLETFKNKLMDYKLDRKIKRY